MQGILGAGILALASLGSLTALAADAKLPFGLATLAGDDLGVYRVSDVRTFDGRGIVESAQKTHDAIESARSQCIDDDTHAADIECGTYLRFLQQGDQIIMLTLSDEIARFKAHGKPYTSANQALVSYLSVAHGPQCETELKNSEGRQLFSSGFCSALPLADPGDPAWQVYEFTVSDVVRKPLLSMTDAETDYATKHPFSLNAKWVRVAFPVAPSTEATTVEAPIVLRRMEASIPFGMSWYRALVLKRVDGAISSRVAN